MLGILALGVFLRAFRLDIFEFKGDELEEIARGLAAPAQHWWIEHGSTASVQIPFGPAFPYIMGLATSVSPDPYIITGFILAANIVVLMLAVLFFAEFSKDRKQFFLCVLLFSLSPYLIIFSRKIWQPNVILFFVIPLVLMVVRVHRDPRLLVPIGLLSSIVVQLHHSGNFYLPVLIFYTVFSFMNVRQAPGKVAPGPEGGRALLLWAAGGLIMFILPLIPFLNFLFHHSGQARISQWLLRVPHNTCLQGALKWVLFSAAGSDFWGYVSSGKGSQWNWPVAPFPGAVTIFCYLLIGPFLLGVFNYAKAARTLFGPAPAGEAGQPDPRILLCPLSIGFLFVVYCFVLDHGRPHHYTIILPFLILALSDGILSLLAYGKSIVRVLLYVGLISYTLQYPFVLSYLDANDGYVGDYGICYREQRNAARRIAALADRGQIAIKPVIELDYFPPSRKRELQETIAYICKTEFGTQVLFTKDPAQGARVLRLLKTGDRLHFEIED
jgi:uncharacterized membrane protein